MVPLSQCAHECAHEHDDHDEHPCRNMSKLKSQHLGGLGCVVQQCSEATCSSNNYKLRRSSALSQRDASCCLMQCIWARHALCHYASLCNGFDWAVSQGRHWTTWFNRGRMLRQALLLWLQGALQCRGQASSFAEFCIILIVSYNTLIQRDEVWWSLGSEVRDLWDPAHDSSRLPDLMEEGLPMPLVSHSASPVHVRCHVSV